MSWLVPSLLTCEHPAMPPAEGAVGILHVLEILTSNPAIWEKTALIVSYDENGGFFDHVPPPVPPPGTSGEYITAPLDGIAQCEGIAGPIGPGPAHVRLDGCCTAGEFRGGHWSYLQEL